MKPYPRWFDRRFEFTLGAELYPVVLERLRGLLPRVHTKLAVIPRELAARRVADTWSIQENLGHLLDLESLWLGRLHDFYQASPVLRPADLENRKTHEADHNRADLDALVDALEQARGDLLHCFDAMAPEDFSRVAKHPRLDQPMRVIDLALFVAEHDDHHLARITAIAAASKSTDQWSEARPKNAPSLARITSSRLKPELRAPKALPLDPRLNRS